MFSLSVLLSIQVSQRQYGHDYQQEYNGQSSSNRYDRLVVTFLPLRSSIVYNLCTFSIVLQMMCAINKHLKLLAAVNSDFCQWMTKASKCLVLQLIHPLLGFKAAACMPDTWVIESVKCCIILQGNKLLSHCFSDNHLTEMAGFQIKPLQKWPSSLELFDCITNRLGQTRNFWNWKFHNMPVMHLWTLIPVRQACTTQKCQRSKLST